MEPQLEGKRQEMLNKVRFLISSLVLSQQTHSCYRPAAHDVCFLSVDSTNSSLRWSRHLKRGCRDNMNSVRWEACHTFWVDFNNGFWAQLRLRFMLCCDTFFLFTVCDDSNMTWTFGLFPSQLTTLLLKRKEGHIVFAFSNKRNQRRKYCIEQLGETTWTCYNLKV